jgi:hypothetical protein
VTMRNYARVSYDPRVGGLTPDSVLPLYKRQEWKECPVKATGAAPDSGC